MYNIYLLQYNNYYNRIIKFENDINSYITLSNKDNMIPDINFRNGDGVNTEIIVNINDGEVIENFDYALVDDGVVFTRWFILGFVRLKDRQWRITLRRDVIADNYSNVINAPTFIEKATISELDPLIFNNEQMTVNQIKEQEILIKDETETAWIVGYVARGEVASQQIVIPKNKEAYDFTISVDSDLFNLKGVDKNDLCYHFYYQRTAPIMTEYLYYPGIKKLYSRTYTITPGGFNEATIPGQITNIENNTLLELSNMYFSTSDEHDFDFDERILLDNKKTYDNNKVYLIKETTYNEVIETTNYFSTSTNIYAILKKLMNNLDIFNVSASYSKYNVLHAYEEVASDLLYYTMDPVRTNLEDAPYDMFAIPLNLQKSIRIGSSSILTRHPGDETSELMLNIAQSIYQSLGTAKCYDIQILPYCPLQGRIEETGTEQFPTLRFYDLVAKDYELIKDGNDHTQAVIFWCNKSKFSKTLYQSIDISDDSLKVLNETTMLRLVSPNYNGVFEYNPFKLKSIELYSREEGKIHIGSNFNVDCDYKPGMPYIHIAPEFSYLYGNNFGDARGLICGGDFSLTRVDDAYVNYVNNNKNFQRIFDRQIENMEFNNKWAIAETSVNAVGGVVQGAAMGAVSGMPYGAIVGAAVGVAQGGLNIAESVARQKETLDYTKDQFGYTLGNIRALPNSLTKVSAMNNNNKLFPFVEVYSCTEREKEAFRNKIKYNGMTVGVIGTIAEYQQEEKTYIKGKLIRLTGVDYNAVTVIAEEINKGVFI